MVILALSHYLYIYITLDVTHQVVDCLEHDLLDAGDLYVASIVGADGLRWLLASFHGDSNGRSARPVLAALHKAYRTTFKDHVLLAGLDANTQSHADRGPGAVGGFRGLLREQVEMQHVMPKHQR
jgi:hypothetical protein